MCFQARTPRDSLFHEDKQFGVTMTWKREKLQHEVRSQAAASVMCCGKTMPRHLSWKFGPQKAKDNLCSTHLALQWSNSMPMWQPPAAERGSLAPPSLQPLDPMLFPVPVMTFFRPFSELWPSKWAIWICVLNPRLSGMRSKNHVPDTTFQLVQKTFSLRWEEAGWLCVGAWCDAWEAETWDVAQDLICADQSIPQQSIGFLRPTEPVSTGCRDVVLTQ